MKNWRHLNSCYTFSKKYVSSPLCKLQSTPFGLFYRHIRPPDDIWECWEMRIYEELINRHNMEKLNTLFTNMRWVESCVQSLLYWAPMRSALSLSSLLNGFWKPLITNTTPFSIWSNGRCGSFFNFFFGGPSVDKFVRDVETFVACVVFDDCCVELDFFCFTWSKWERKTHLVIIPIGTYYSLTQ